MLWVGLPCLHVLTAPFRVSAINVYKIGLPFTQTLARGLLIAFPNEKNILLNSDMSHLDLDHQIRLFVFSDSAVFDKVSTAIGHYGRHAQWAMKMFQILSYSVTAWNNYIPAFLTAIYVKAKRRRI